MVHGAGREKGFVSGGVVQIHIHIAACAFVSMRGWTMGLPADVAALINAFLERVD